MLPYIAEFLGTMLLILLGDGVVANVTLNKSGMKGAGSVQITFAWGLAVMIPACIFGAASGASFNPALTLALSVGEPFSVEAADGSRVPLVLTGITENYMFTRLYLSNAQLQALLGSTPEWNTVYGLTGCTTEAEYNALRTKLLGCNYVSSVSFTEDTTSMFGSLIGSLNYVVVLIIVCAAALAAVVLYNLISVNLAERKKELATIKVLGFYDKEVYRYIFREIELLSLIGSGVGLLLGVPLHRFIVLTVEMDQLMFIRTIAPRSYLLAVALTMLFTVVVCFAMRRHVRHISMVESMKAPE